MYDGKTDDELILLLRDSTFKDKDLLTDYILNKYLEENNWNKKLALYGNKGVEKNIKVKGIIENMIKIEKKIDKELK